MQGERPRVEEWRAVLERFHFQHLIINFIGNQNSSIFVDKIVVA